MKELQKCVNFEILRSQALIQNVTIIESNLKRTERNLKYLKRELRSCTNGGHDDAREHPVREHAREYVQLVPDPPRVELVQHDRQDEEVVDDGVPVVLPELEVLRLVASRRAHERLWDEARLVAQRREHQYQNDGADVGGHDQHIPHHSRGQ